MTGPPPPPNPGMVRTLLIAIALMTVAIVFILGAMFGRILAPSGAPPPRGTIDFAAAPEVEIGLPPGARVVETHVGADRATFVIETAQGEQAVYTTSLAGFDAPARLVFRTLE